MRTELVCIYVLRLASRLRVKLAVCKSALKPPMVYSTDRSKAVVLVLILLSLCCFVFFSTRRFILSFALCYIVLAFFSPFSIAITSLETANLSAFNAFVRFARV